MSSAAAALVRREIKIPMCAADALQLDAFLLDSPVQIRRTYPPRHVNSYYYDTYANDDYVDNVIGIANRVKLRFRWYGDICGRLPVALECKRKTGTTSFKNVAHLGEQTTGLGTFRAAQAIENVRLDPMMAARLARRRQRRLFVRYERRYLGAPDGVRLTIDQNIRYGDGREHEPVLLTSPVHTVLELKFRPDRSDSVDRLLERLPFRLFRHSKYVVGVGVCGG